MEVTVLVGFVAILVILYRIWGDPKRRAFAAIPGPRPWPLVGNFPQMDLPRCHITFFDWARKYGPIYTISLGGEHIVVLNGYDGIYETLVTKGKVCAGRMKTFRLEKISSNYQDIALGDPSEQHTLLRKTTHQLLKQYGSGLDTFEGIVNDLILDFMDVLKTKGSKAFDPYDDIFYFLQKVFFVYLFGEIPNDNDHRFQLHRTMESELVSVTRPFGPGSELDLFPWLRYFGNKNYMTLLQGLAHLTELWENHAKADMQSKDLDNPSTLVESLLKITRDHPHLVQNESAKRSFMHLSLGGVVTTAIGMKCLMNVLPHYLNVQQKMQKEADAILQDGRQPTLADREKMPYTQATLLELLRYSSILPHSVPHLALEDCTIQGYHLPKGTPIIHDVFYLLHDPDYWKDPFKFDPDRFLDAEGQVILADHENRKRLLSFGAGPRVCVGEVFAKSRMFLTVANLMQQFTVLPDDTAEMVSCDPRSYSFDWGLRAQAYKVRFEERNK